MKKIPKIKSILSGNLGEFKIKSTVSGGPQKIKEHDSIYDNIERLDNKSNFNKPLKKLLNKMFYPPFSYKKVSKVCQHIFVITMIGIYLNLYPALVLYIVLELLIIWISYCIGCHFTYKRFNSPNDKAEVRGDYEQ